MRRRVTALMKADMVWTFAADSGGIAFDEAWSPSGTLLGVAGLDEGPQIWDVSTGRRAVAASHPELVSCIAWSPDGARLIGGSSAGELVVFDTGSGAVLGKVVGHSGEVRSVAYSNDGHHVASGANDGHVIVWNAADLAKVTTISGHGAIVRSVGWSPAGHRLASGGHDSTVRVWDPETGAADGGLGDHQAWVTTVAYSPDSRLLASASLDSTVRIWDLAAGAYLCVLDDFDQWWVEGLAFSPDSKCLATIDQNGTIRVWRLDTQELMLTLLAGAMNKTVSWSPDARYLASGGAGGEQVWVLAP
jgi:WD40 repeat protein